MSNDNLIIDPLRPSNEAARIREANQRLQQILDEHCPAGVGYVLVVFESPMSLRRPQVALATDHDAATVERLFVGVLDQIHGRTR
jgi:hypothetical protein